MRKVTQQSGFTLVECLVAITVLLIGVLGPLTIAARGISDGLYARNQITANYLAQEAIESIIWRRNYNFSLARYEYDTIDDSDLPGALTAWTNNLTPNCITVDSSNPCFIDLNDRGYSNGRIGEEIKYNADSIADLTTNLDLVYDKSIGGYVRANSPPISPIGTIFRREVFLKPYPAVFSSASEIKEIEATIKMTWFNRGTKKVMYLTERLYPRF